MDSPVIIKNSKRTSKEIRGNQLELGHIRSMLSVVVAVVVYDITLSLVILYNNEN